MHRTRGASVLFLIAAVSLSPVAQGWQSNGHWVPAWSTAADATRQLPFLPPPPVFENQTIRMVIHPTIAGDRIQVRFSNEFGTTNLMIGAAHIALLRSGSAILAESDRVLKFSGRPSVTIPPGAPMLSDPVDFKFPAFADIAISVYVPEKVTLPTGHFWGQHDTYISGPGDLSAQADLPNATVKASWFFLADVEVWASLPSAAVVTLGDSITDGVGAKTGEYADWPDILANRLAAEQNVVPLAVVNKGIGGNRVLHDGAGVSALARLDRDVLALPGIASVILMEGINDIGWPNIKPRPSPGGSVPKENPFAGEVVTSDEIIAGLQQLAARAHQHGLKVFGATLTPYEGAEYYTTEGEAAREAVNQWIRTSRDLDGVFDFDAVVRDPNHPARFLARYDSGDHLHPGAAGYKAMADSIDLAALRGIEGSKARK
ncbi:MAG TPA: SGNH/GDSL hydrolase family protein [Terriglobales bacterium]|nr:SGNH/GDSL hydrolase family protein [Terriglobales bacterium]